MTDGRFLALIGTIYVVGGVPEKAKWLVNIVGLAILFSSFFVK